MACHSHLVAQEPQAAGYASLGKMSRGHGRKVDRKESFENVVSDSWIFDGQSPGDRSIDACHCDHPSGDSSVGV